MICVSISDPDQIGPVLEAGVSLLEFRFDLMNQTPGSIYGSLPAGIRTVATCRPGRHTDPQRMRLLQECISLGAAFIDLELESDDKFLREMAETAGRNECEVICSHHDFKSTPPSGKLKELLEGCYGKGASVAKIATWINNKEDLIALLSLYSYPGRKIILGMGEMGRISRVLAPYLGSEFTFAAPSAGEETAPGQLAAEDLMNIYKLVDVT
jgi:3-dehydroquinate dehydratase-1